MDLQTESIVELMDVVGYQRARVQVDNIANDLMLGPVIGLALEALDSKNQSTPAASQNTEPYAVRIMLANGTDLTRSATDGTTARRIAAGTHRLKEGG